MASSTRGFLGRKAASPTPEVDTGSLPGIGSTHVSWIGFKGEIWERFGPWEERMATFSRSRWWFQIFFLFSPLFGEDFQFDEHIFQMG